MARRGIGVLVLPLLLAGMAGPVWAQPAPDQEVSGQAASDQEASNRAAVIEQAEELEQAVADDGAPAAAAEPITANEAEAVDPAGEAALDDPLTCLARSIYWEAKGEDVAAMEAVANVVMNRLAAEGFPDTVCGVVTEGGETGACQFSWWCDGLPDDVEEPERFEITMDVARRALNQELEDRTEGALFFHATDTSAAWADEMVATTTVGPHRFYRPAEDAD